MEHNTDRQDARPLTESEADVRARQLIDAAYRPTSYRDDSPVPAYGPTPPVAQEGRPPMSQRATDASALMLSGSVAALSVGGATSLVLFTLGQVDPTTLAVAGAAPVALVLAVGSLIRSAGRAKADAHTEHHHHYNGSVRQETTNVSSTTKGLFAKNRNDVR
ncbi:hypothetical protein ABZ069_36560 [Streptomyces microflavus]|uniref:hypothetical protein n=1 Tax=Streptomyces microflavus TaxID=1919 RepID=UPI0033B6E439